MRRLCLALLVLAACDEEDNFCEPNKHIVDIQALDTQVGDFVDNYDYANDWAVQDTAVGGFQHVFAGNFDDCGTPLPASAVTATSNAPAIVTAAAVGEQEIELHAYQAGTARITAVNAAGISDTLDVHATPMDAIRLVAPELGEPTAFYRGAPFARIILLAADGKPLVDRSLEVGGDLPRGQRWNELAIAGAAVGDHAVTIVAGGASWPTTVKVVDSIDSIVVVPGLSPYDACFRALLGDDIVGGVPWQIDIDSGYHYASDQANCISVYGGYDGPRSITVTAHALGLTATTMITL